MRATLISFVFLFFSASASAQVAGTVVDDITDEPIAEAVVSIQATEIETSTDETGAFDLTDAAGQGLVVVAGAKGYFYASAVATTPRSGLELRLEPVPQVDDPWYTFQSPERCRTCHQQQYDEWYGSPMSKAGLNTWVYDIYNGEGTGTTGSQGSSTCATRCMRMRILRASAPLATNRSHGRELHSRRSATSTHPPPVWCTAWPATCVTESPTSTSAGPTSQASTLGSLRSPVRRDWIRATRSCTVCWATLRIRRRAGCAAAYQPQLRSEICAACHQDKNDPDLSGDFESEAAIISEPTYLEWLASDYANPDSEVHAECVDCHMPATRSSRSLRPSVVEAPG